MEDGTAQTTPAEEPVSALTRWMHRLYYLYMVLVPALTVFGLLNLKGAPAEYVHGLLAVPVLHWVLKGSLVIAGIAYLAFVTELARPPKSPLVTLLLICDTPALVYLGALAGGPPQLEILAYDGVLEATAAVLSLIPVQFTGSVRIPAKTGSDIPKAMLLIAAFAAGPLALFGALFAGLAAEGAWIGLATMTVAIGWGSYSFYKLLRYAPSNQDNWGWVIFGIMGPLLGGIAYGVIKGLTS